MKRINQVNESKDMITRAFQKLLKEYDFNDITLTEIADHAGLTRMTLHRHFKSKEKILLYMAQIAMNEATGSLKEGENSFKDLILLRLEGTAKMPNLSVLIESREIEELLYSFRKTAYTEYLEENWGCKNDDDPYVFHFFYGGINRIIIEWLKSGCIESAHEITDKIMHLINLLKK